MTDHYICNYNTTNHSNLLISPVILTSFLTNSPSHSSHFGLAPTTFLLSQSSLSAYCSLFVWTDSIWLW